MACQLFDTIIQTNDDSHLTTQYIKYVKAIKRELSSSAYIMANQLLFDSII